MREGLHIIFRLADDIPEARKTAIWDVRAKVGGFLGQVRWFSRWRKYSFFPAPGCVFEGTCMREISQFIEDRTTDRRRSGAGDRNNIGGRI
jgi:hypothetical protein